MRRLAAILFLLSCAPQLWAQRTYWHATVAQLASGAFPHTHVELDSVVVTYKAIESDSDFHMRLRDPRDTVSSHFVIAECIPLMPCQHPKLGQVVNVRGISRKDAEHGWFEIHPIEAIVPRGT